MNSTTVSAARQLLTMLAGGYPPDKQEAAMRGSFVLGAMLFGAGMVGAVAAPVCTTTNNLGPTGDGIVLASQITSGYCVLAKDKLYGTFNLGNLPKDLVLIFNNNTVGGLTHYQLSFDGTYKSGTLYNWGYEVAVAAFAPKGTAIVSLDSDFTQTVGGPSALDKTTTPTTVPPIHVVKIGPLAQPGSVFTTSFGSGITDLMIGETLNDKGTISSVTNTVVQFTPPHNPGIPEPATLALMGTGLVGFRLLRRRRRA